MPTRTTSSESGRAIAAVWSWYATGEASGAPRYGLADGCTYLLFGFATEHAGSRELIYARVIGPRTKPFLIDNRPRLCIGVRFAPGFAQAAFAVPASELVDQRIDYGLLYAGGDADLVGLQAANADAARVSAALGLAQRRLGSPTRVPPSLQLAVAHITAAAGNIRLGPLADRIGITRQQLARQFAAHVGMTAKQFARVKRAEAVRAQVQIMQDGSQRGLNWSMVAHERGYYDQAHLIKDFRALTGLTPGRWLR